MGDVVLAVVFPLECAIVESDEWVLKGCSLTNREEEEKAETALKK